MTVLPFHSQRSAAVRVRRARLLVEVNEGVDTGVRARLLAECFDELCDLGGTMTAIDVVARVKRLPRTTASDIVEAAGAGAFTLARNLTARQRRVITAQLQLYALAYQPGRGGRVA